jgi:glycosyltransferase involved in cell wall biosynthesis
MRLNCLSFLDPFVYSGGGEMITRRLIEHGRLLGHDIRITSVRPRRRAAHPDPDLTLLIDVFNHGHSAASLGAWRAFGEGVLEAAAAAAPFVHLTNAYVDVCNLASLPCSGAAAAACPHKPLSLARQVLLRDFGDRCFATSPLVRLLFENAALNVFLSPLHKRVTEQILGGIALRRSLILKPLIDTRLFRNARRPRDIEYLFVGVVSEAKGLSAMRERFNRSDIHLVGRLAPGVSVDFGHYLGPRPYSEIPSWMNRAANFVFLPRWPEPQGRVVAEAALCGCRLIANESVGALSFDFDLADPSNYNDGEALFWNAVQHLR